MTTEEFEELLALGLSPAQLDAELVASPLRNRGARLPDRGVPTLALRRTEAAEALGISDELFDRHVRPTLPSVSLGALEIYPVSSLTEWLTSRGLSPVEEAKRHRDS